MTTISALLIIDVQQGLFKKSTRLYQADQLLDNLLLLIERAHQARAPIIYVQHNASFMPNGSQEWQLHPRLQPLPGELVMQKHHGSAFEETNLQEELDARGVKRVVIGGLVTHGCIRAGCLAALELGYQVTLASDGHSSYSKDAAQLIEKWNAALAEQGVEVKPSAQIEF